MYYTPIYYYNDSLYGDFLLFFIHLYTIYMTVFSNFEVRHHEPMIINIRTFWVNWIK